MSDAKDEAEGWSWYFGAGSAPEVYYPASSREEAIAGAQVDANLSGYEQMTICQGRPQALDHSIFDADLVLERFHEVNETLADEDGNLRMEPKPEQCRELEATLAATFKSWCEKHKLGRAWSMDTRNDEVIEIEQEDAAYGDDGRADTGSADISTPGRVG